MTGLGRHREGLFLRYPGTTPSTTVQSNLTSQETDCGTYTVLQPTLLIAQLNPPS